MAFWSSTCIFLAFVSFAATFPQGAQQKTIGNLPNITGQDLGKNEYGQRVRQCYQKDNTKFPQCLQEFWTAVSPKLKTGIPELGIPVMDPMKIKNLHFNEQGSSVKADATFTNIVIVGASQVRASNVRVDKKTKTASVDLFFPHLNATGDYVIKGEIMLLPIDGKGKFVLNLADVNAVATLHISQKGTGVTAEKITLDFNIKSLFVRLDGLLGGDSVGEAVNAMLNENSQAILTDIKPAIVAKFQQVFLDMTKGAFLDMPPEAFIA